MRVLNHLQERGLLGQIPKRWGPKEAGRWFPPSDGISYVRCIVCPKLETKTKIEHDVMRMDSGEELSSSS